MTSTLPPTPQSAPPSISWTEADQPCTALWHSERGAPAPKRLVLADDTMNADTAYRLACEGVGLLWQGDFQNARMLVQALARRTDRLPERQQFKANKQSARLAVKRLSAATGTASAPPSSTTTAVTSDNPAATNPIASNRPTASTAQTRAAEAFHHHRLIQSQRARVLGMVLVPLDEAYQITLRRAPDVQAACADVWGALDSATAAKAQDRLLAHQQAAGLVAKPGSEPADPPFIESFDEPGKPAKLSKFEQKIIKESKGAVTHITSLRELLGMTSTHEWRKKGVEVPALGEADNRIHPHYGVFSPVRGEYVGLVAKAPLPVSSASKTSLVAWDIGTGTGVLAAKIGRASCRERVLLMV